MPTYFNPRRVDIQTGGGGGLVAAAVVVVAAGAGVIWLVREILRAWVEIAVILGGTAAIMAVFVTLVIVQNRRGGLRVDEAAKAYAIASARAAVPAGEVHHHVHYEQHHHLHQAPAAEQHVHVHQAQPAAEPRPAITGRKVVPGEVLGADREAIEARRAQPWQSVAGEEGCMPVITRPGRPVALRRPESRDNQDR